jgi:hypothetical protein
LAEVVVEGVRKLFGDVADASATRTRQLGEAEAAATKAIVGEASKAFASIGSMTVLNGAEGVGEVFRRVLGMGVAAIPMLRGALEQTDGGGNGAKRHGAAREEENEAAR